jgi:predicted aldo/keto reductase-like oxidoreductase
LRLLPKHPVISTKTYAWDEASASASLDKARQALDLDVIDIFLLHEQESSLTLDGHREAFAWLLEQKGKGLIRAVGISTHAVEPVLALTAAKRPDLADLAIWRDRDPGPYRDADLIHPLLNLRGIGLLDGNAADMVAACSRAHDAGLGIYGMKMLGGGHLLQDFTAAADFALNLRVRLKSI